MLLPQQFDLLLVICRTREVNEGQSMAYILRTANGCRLNEALLFKLLTQSRDAIGVEIVFVAMPCLVGTLAAETSFRAYLKPLL